MGLNIDLVSYRPSLNRLSPDSGRFSSIPANAKIHGIAFYILRLSSLPASPCDLTASWLRSFLFFLWPKVVGWKIQLVNCFFKKVPSHYSFYLSFR